MGREGEGERDRERLGREGRKEIDIERDKEGNINRRSEREDWGEMEVISRDRRKFKREG